jgi:ATP-dependent Zn protease
VVVKRIVERYPRGTAYHEAGHAVVAWALSLPVGTIRVWEEDAGGGTEIGSASHLSLIEQIAIRAAGHAAEQVFGYELTISRASRIT